jgi:hypothetical protein
LSELHLAPPLSRAELRRALRERIHELGASLRVVAEEVLGESSAVDLVAIDAAGGVVLVLIGDEGDDAELFTRSLALRSWVASRLRDWAQLAPSLELRPEAPVRSILVCPAYDPETLCAARSLGEGAPELRIARCVQDGPQRSVLLEAAPAAEGGRPLRRPGEPREPAPFRSGLSEADLDLSAQELRDLEVRPSGTKIG